MWTFVSKKYRGIKNFFPYVLVNQGIFYFYPHLSPEFGCPYVFLDTTDFLLTAKNGFSAGFSSIEAVLF